MTAQTLRLIGELKLRNDDVARELKRTALTFCSDWHFLAARSGLPLLKHHLTVLATALATVIVAWSTPGICSWCLIFALRRQARLTQKFAQDLLDFGQGTRLGVLGEFKCTVGTDDCRTGCSAFDCGPKELMLCVFLRLLLRCMFLVNWNVKQPTSLDARLAYYCAGFCSFVPILRLASLSTG